MDYTVWGRPGLLTLQSASSTGGHVAVIMLMRQTVQFCESHGAYAPWDRICIRASCKTGGVRRNRLWVPLAPVGVILQKEPTMGLLRLGIAFARGLVVACWGSASLANAKNRFF